MTDPQSKTIRTILEEKLKRAYFNGSTDVVARKNGVIPNNTELGEIQINVLVDQALSDISKIIDEAQPYYMPEFSKYAPSRAAFLVNKAIDQYQSNLKDILGDDK